MKYAVFGDRLVSARNLAIAYGAPRMKCIYIDEDRDLDRLRGLRPGIDYIALRRKPQGDYQLSPLEKPEEEK